MKSGGQPPKCPLIVRTRHHCPLVNLQLFRLAKSQGTQRHKTNNKRGCWPSAEGEWENFGQILTQLYEFHFYSSADSSK